MRSVSAVINHPHVNEAQTVSQIFFPNTKFSVRFLDGNPADDTAREILSGQMDDSQAADASLGETPPGWLVKSYLLTGKAFAEVYRGGAILSSGEFPLNTSTFISEKRALMLALFYALKKATGAPTPWGSLTGIRPSKLVRQWTDEGLTPEETVKLLREPFGCEEDRARLAVTTAAAEKKLTEQIYTMAGGFNPLGLYVSVPFCPSRCLYCSFNMGKSYGDEFYSRYLDAIERDCAEKARLFREAEGMLTSVYIGGGTPTVFSAALLERLLGIIEKYFGTRVFGMEYTAEAGRPDSLTAVKLRVLRGYGVNRIAVNPQTLNDETLKRIGRSHTSADFFRAFELARGAGFDVINADVIAGLPGEDMQDMENTMDGLMRLKPENVTVHTLAVKRASRLNESLRENNAEDFPENSPDAVSTVRRMLEIAGEACRDAGLAPYYLYRQKNTVGLFENVGYSLHGYECLYNVGMMAETQTILGVGAGAVCKFVDGDKIERTFNAKNPEMYVN